MRPWWSVRGATMDGMTNFFSDLARSGPFSGPFSGDDPLRDDTMWDESPWDDDDDDPPPVLALTTDQQAALAGAIDAGLRRDGCDNSLTAAARWATDAGVSWPPLRAQLQGNGGYCDCEILLNVFGPAEWTS